MPVLLSADVTLINLVCHSLPDDAVVVLLTAGVTLVYLECRGLYDDEVAYSSTSMTFLLRCCGCGPHLPVQLPSLST